MLEEESAIEKRERRLQLVVEETMETEQTYVNSLVDMEQMIFLCHAKCKPKGPFEKIDIELLFGNIRDLLKFHIDLLERLNTCIDYPWFAGTFFNDSADEMMNLYIIYCSNHSASMEALGLLLNDPPVCAEIQTLTQGMGKPLGLGPELLKPVQRILKYPLLLKELLKYSEEGEDGYEDALEAMDKISGVAEYINNRKAADESMQRVVSIQDRLDNFKGDITTYGLLIRDTPVRVSVGSRRPAERRLILFQKIILLAKQDYSGRLNFKDLLTISKITVKKIDDPAMFDLITSEKRNTFRVSCRDPAECKSLIGDIERYTESDLISFLAQKSKPNINLEEHDALKDIDVDAIQRREKRLRELRNKKHVSHNKGISVAKKISHLSIQEVRPKSASPVSPVPAPRVLASTATLASTHNSPKSLYKSNTVTSSSVRSESSNRRLSYQQSPPMPTTVAPMRQIVSEWNVPDLEHNNTGGYSPGRRNQLPPPLPPARKTNNVDSGEESSQSGNSTTSTAYDNDEDEDEAASEDSEFEIDVRIRKPDIKRGSASPRLRPPSYPPARPPGFQKPRPPSVAPPAVAVSTSPIQLNPARKPHTGSPAFARLPTAPPVLPRQQSTHSISRNANATLSSNLSSLGLRNRSVSPPPIAPKPKPPPSVMAAASNKEIPSHNRAPPPSSAPPPSTFLTATSLSTSPPTPPNVLASVSPDVPLKRNQSRSKIKSTELAPKPPKLQARPTLDLGKRM
eukprot:CFRG1409T1